MPWHHQIAMRIGLFDMFGLFAKTLALQNFVALRISKDLASLEGGQEPVFCRGVNLGPQNDDTFEGSGFLGC